MGFPSQAIFGINTLLQLGDGGSPENFTTIAEVRSIAGPTLSNDILDVTNHDSQGGVREFKAGLTDPGDLTFDLNFQPAEPTHDDLTGTLSLLISKAVRNFQLVFPGAIRTWGFAGIMTGHPVNFPIDDVLTANVTLKVTGIPNFNV